MSESSGAVTVARVARALHLMSHQHLAAPEVVAEQGLAAESADKGVYLSEERVQFRRLLARLCTHPLH